VRIPVREDRKKKGEGKRWEEEGEEGGEDVPLSSTNKQYLTSDLTFLLSVGQIGCKFER
jgi:hypothetical protein